MTGDQAAPRPRKAPPFRPDPDIVGNIEGNQRILRADRKAIRKMLEEAIAADRAAGRLDETLSASDAPATP